MSRGKFSNILILFAFMASLAAGAADLSASPLFLPNGRVSDSSFFPIVVWDQRPSNARAYKAEGINLYIGLWNGPTQSQLDQLKAVSMPVLCDQNSLALKNLQNNIIAGWIQMDEPDNAQEGAHGGWDPCVDPDSIIHCYRQMKKADSSRPVFLCLDMAVSYTNWIGRGVCKGRNDMYPRYIKGCDIATYDIYPVNDEIRDVRGNLWYVAKGIDSLRKWCNDEKPVWTWIECTSIHGGKRPTTAQVKSEVWMALVHGVSGIGYFCHAFKPEVDDAALLHDREMCSAVSAINKRITSLATVLNSPTIGGVAVFSSNTAVPVDFMVKKDKDCRYIFAVAMRNDTTTTRFSIPGIANHDSVVTVLDENRSIPIANGTFSDKFQGYGVHLYQIGRKNESSARLEEFHYR